MLCGVPDCEHFDIPDRVHPDSWWHYFMDKGYQPFIYTPFVQLFVTGKVDNNRKKP